MFQFFHSLQDEFGIEEQEDVANTYDLFAGPNLKLVRVVRCRDHIEFTKVRSEITELIREGVELRFARDINTTS